MNPCLLCEKNLVTSFSWKSLLGLDERTIICESCSKNFQIAEIIEEGMIVDQITSLYAYNDAMRSYLHQFKFLQDVALAEVFAKEIKRSIPKGAIVVPIPIHPKKRMERTFAHIDELLKCAHVSYVHVLEKTGTERMGEKTKQERLAMAPLFKLKPQVVIQPSTYILIDDIYTTGTTLRHAASLLKEAGATRVEAITLIRA
ncbi:ComF family protein [Sporosarcina sp. CAU 1771]